jgi:hypothetical protein
MTADECETTDALVVAEPADGSPARAAGRAAAARYHRAILILSLAVLIASAVLGNTPEGDVKLPLAGGVAPRICFWRLSTGMDCPGCGLTRCFVAMAHGDWAQAIHFHPVGMVLFLIVLAQVPYRAVQLRRLARGREELKHPALHGILWLLVAAFFVQWLLKTFGLVVF